MLGGFKREVAGPTGDEERGGRPGGEEVGESRIVGGSRGGREDRWRGERDPPPSVYPLVAP